MAKLNIEPILGQPGYDIEEVRRALGPERFDDLGKFLSSRSVFVCGHRRDASGNEVYCVYEKDLDQFLESEGT